MSKQENNRNIADPVMNIREIGVGADGEVGRFFFTPFISYSGRRCTDDLPLLFIALLIKYFSYLVFFGFIS